MTEDIRSILEHLQQSAPSRRERIATAVFVSFAMVYTAKDGAAAAKHAVEWADALIAELDRED